MALAVVPVVVREIADPLDGERILIESNRQRRKTPDQRQKEADALVRIIGEQARGRMVAGVTEDGAGGRGNKRNPPATLPEGYPPDAAPHGETAERVAEIVGVKARTFRKERAVYQVAKGQRDAPPQVQAVARQEWARLNAGETTAHAAERKVREAERATRGEEETADLETLLERADKEGRIRRHKELSAVHNALNAITRHDAASIAQAVRESDDPDTFDHSLRYLNEWLVSYRRHGFAIVEQEVG